MNEPESNGRCDFILTGGTVVDGTGAPGRRADVAVDGDRIVAVGDLSGWSAEAQHDASGRVVAPGFIDVHTHDDRAVLDEPCFRAKLSQGVTTVIVGNCGISLAPLVPAGDLPQPFDLLGEPDGFQFPTMGSYLDRLADAPAALNVGALVGHATLRVQAMADLGHAADGDELAAMREGLRMALRQGGLGLSTGLFYPPGRAATTEEVVELSKVMAEEGGLYVTHMRDEADGVETSLEETMTIGREAGVPVMISHHKVVGPANFGRSVQTLARIEAARRAQPVALDCYPYAASSTVLVPERCGKGTRILVTWSKAHPEQAGRELSAIAADWDCKEAEAAERLRPAGAVYFAMDEEDVQRILRFSDTMVGSDGLPHDLHPHPRLWGTFPRVLGHYVREHGIMSLEEAVHRMTGVSARTFGLTDRGEIRAGAYADLVVFDPTTVIDRATFESPERPSDGIDLVTTNGAIVWRDGAATGARPGRPLARQRERRVNRTGGRTR